MRNGCASSMFFVTVVRDYLSLGFPHFVLLCEFKYEIWLTW